MVHVGIVESCARNNNPVMPMYVDDLLISHCDLCVCAVRVVDAGIEQVGSHKPSIHNQADEITVGLHLPRV